MKFRDLLRMSSTNLLRRKLRTVLTVLGVVIGTASIVVMISLGLGLQKISLAQIEEYGGLTTIDVYSNDYYGGSTDDKDAKRLSDEVVEEISQLSHVEIVSPILSINVMAKQGAYEANLQIQGMTAEALEKMDFKIGQGELPSPDTLDFFYGNQILTNFYNAKKNEYYWDTGVLPDVDLMGDPLFIIFDTEAYWQSKGGSGEDGQTVAAPKKYIIPTSGVMAGGPEDYSNGAYNVYADIEPLKAQLKKVFKNKAIPGQPTNSNGKPYKELYYNSLYVRVDDIDYVTEIQKQIQDMGFEASSNAEWMEQTQQQMQTIQLVLGGIGAVSLFVAAIGIANTMMMSIYERTKEIGIIKVLGCDLKNIRTMFLMEAGFIGFFGGLAGLIVSYGISAIINVMAGEAYRGVSYIPIWLTLLSLVFAVLVGMVSGFFPALRAMKLSPLAAIRNE